MLRPSASWEILCARWLTLSAKLCPTILWLNESRQSVAAIVIMRHVLSWKLGEEWRWSVHRCWWSSEAAKLLDKAPASSKKTSAMVSPDGTLPTAICTSVIEILLLKALFMLIWGRKRQRKSTVHLVTSLAMHLPCNTEHNIIKMKCAAQVTIDVVILTFSDI